MANQEVIDWIKSEEAQGYSEKALTGILTKQGYNPREIKGAFNSLKDKQNETPWSISFTILAGLGFVSLILVAIVLSVASFSAGKIVGYFLIILLGAGIGYYIYHLKQKLNATERLGAIFGIFSPTLSLILIITSLTILQRLSEQLATFSVQEQVVGGFPDLLSIFTPSMDPIISATLFYLFCNLFVIVSIIKSKEYQTFLWYLLAPTLFFIVWLMINLFTYPIMKGTLGG